MISTQTIKVHFIKTNLQSAHSV